MNEHDGDVDVGVDATAGDDRYLWDRSGPADPEVARLEALLGRYRLASGPAPAGARAPARRGAREAAAPRFPFLAAAAAVLVAAGLAAWLGPRAATTTPERRGAGPGPAYEVLAVAGDVRIRPASAGPASADRARAGDVIETDAASRARVVVGDIGEVLVLERSRVRLVDCGAEQHRMDLERGAIRASIFAEPRVFQVGTPAAIAVDLGCVYELSVDAEGGTLLAVELGRVSFEIGGRKVYVPSGAVCRADPRRGPGLPVWTDAAPALRAAVRDLEAGAAALAACLDAATDRDTLTLWHLLDRLAVAADRGRVFDRLSAIASPPEGVTRDGCVRGDRAELDAWKERLARDW